MISSLLVLSIGYQLIEASVIEPDNDYLILQPKRALNDINQKSSAE